MFNRKVAFVDLSTGTISKKDIPLAWREKYLGGRGINALMLYSLVEPGYDPLGPENPLLIGGGWLSGLPGFGPGRTDITAMSPQSGNLASSNHGGFFSPELKYAGFDHLVIRGQSKSPVYLFIKDGNIEIRDAVHLWGKDMFQTQQMIKQENNDPRVVGRDRHCRREPCQDCQYPHRAKKCGRPLRAWRRYGFKEVEGNRRQGHNGCGRETSKRASCLYKRAHL